MWLRNNRNHSNPFAAGVEEAPIGVFPDTGNLDYTDSRRQGQKKSGVRSKGSHKTGVRGQEKKKDKFKYSYFR